MNSKQSNPNVSASIPSFDGLSEGTTMIADDHPTPTALRRFLGTAEPTAEAPRAFDDYRTCEVILSLLPTRRLVFAHKQILATASNYFCVLFESGFAESSRVFVEIEVPASEFVMLACLAFTYEKRDRLFRPDQSVDDIEISRTTMMVEGKLLTLREVVGRDSSV